MFENDDGWLLRFAGENAPVNRPSKAGLRREARPDETSAETSSARAKDGKSKKTLRFLSHSFGIFRIFSHFGGRAGLARNVGRRTQDSSGCQRCSDPEFAAFRRLAPLGAAWLWRPPIAVEVGSRPSRHLGDHPKDEATSQCNILHTNYLGCFLLTVVGSHFCV